VKRSIFLVLVQFIFNHLLGAEVQVGISENALLSAQPSEFGLVERGNRKLYQWPELEVIVVDGFVQSLKERNLPRDLSPAEVQAAIDQESRIQEIRRKQVEKAKILREKQAIENQAYADEQKQLAVVESSIEAEVSRWKQKEDEVRRETTLTEFRKWKVLRDNYLSAFKEELLATYSGDNGVASVKEKVRSRLELDLNRRTDRFLNDYDDKDRYRTRTKRGVY